MIRHFQRMAFCAALLIVLGLPVRAQDVTLTSRDGSIEVTGTLLSYDGEFYRLDTVYGALTLDGQGVICAGVGCPDLQAFVARFVFSGDPGIGAVLLPALVEGFAADRQFALTRQITSADNFRIDLSDPADGRRVAEIGFRLNSAEEGFADLLTGGADVVMAMREIHQDEAARALEAGLGDLTQPARSQIIALDALIPIVAPDNLRRDMGMEELRAILSGRQQSWPALDLPIALHLADHGDGFGDLLRRRLQLPDTEAAPALVTHADAATLSDAVAADPLALGLVRRSERGNARALSLVGDCGVALRTDRRALMAEDYPLTAPLFLYMPARRLPLLAREFFDYLSTNPAQRIVRRAGFVELGWESIPMAAQGDRLLSAITHAGADVALGDLQQMAQALSGADRLTTTFHFRDGSSELDAQSHGNIATLARALESGAFDGQTLIFAGFSDSAGAAAANRSLSRTRAEAVRSAVRKAGFAADFSRVKLRVEGFGEAMPMACDETVWGRGMNRRVEVWLR